MRVLVTGGCGFIGSHVCEFYRARGASVISYDNMTKVELQRTQYAVDRARDYNWDYLTQLGVEMVKADIRNYDALLETAKGADYIVHTAAQPAVTISMEDVDLDFSSNVLGTLNVLKTAREYDIPVASCATIHVYGNLINNTLVEGATRYLRTPPEIDESHQTMEGLLTPLHASKRAAELYLQVFIDTYKVRAASYRLTGLYGPRQLGGEDHGWVANFSIRTLLGWPLNVYGTGKQVRDILFATDVAEAFHAFYERQVPGIYNIGGGMNNAISLLECIDLIGSITGRKPDVQMGPGRHGDLHYFVCDSAKARRELQWTPKVRPSDGVRQLIDWTQANFDLFRSASMMTERRDQGIV
jgi:CDP-paratose 2-epimerase